MCSFPGTEHYEHYGERKLKWNQPDTKGQILHNSTYMKWPEQAKPQREEVEMTVPEAGAGGGAFTRTNFYFR